MFNERLKQLRLKNSMSQKELAGKLAVSQQTVAKWESGTASPNPDTLKNIVNVFSVSADYLLEISTKVSNEAIKSALFGDDIEIPDSMFEDVKRFAIFLKQRHIEDSKLKIKEI